MGSKNKTQYASLPSLLNHDLSCQQMNTRREASNMNVNILQREHSVTLLEDQTSNILNEKIEKDLNSRDRDLSICKGSYSQLGAKPRSQYRDSSNMSHRLRKKDSTKHNSTSQKTFFKSHRTNSDKENCLTQTKGIETCNGDQGRTNWGRISSKTNS